MADLYLFRSTDRNAETVTNDKSGKTLPPDSFGQWIFSRTIVFNAETRRIGDADCSQVLAIIAKDGHHRWPELESSFPARRER